MRGGRFHVTAVATALLAGTAAAGDLPPPVTDDMFVPVAPAEARLGQMLFYDPILSGNRNISCATCHHPRFGTADGLPLGVGEGGIGLGPERHADPDNIPEDRVPRHAPPLFNLGAREFTVMFDDGRVEADPARPSGLRTPMEDEMTLGFSGVLSAQTMFPVVSADEMAGQVQENDIALAVRKGMITGPDGAWGRLAARVAAIPAYRAMFAEAYDEIAEGRPIAFTDISNAVAGFIAFEWRSDASAFDAHLRGKAPLQGAARRGMDLFYGRAGCDGCHSGPFQTDHGFHAMGVPQFGPGKAASFESHLRDEGRMRVTGDPADAFAFRTPPLRNVALTAPYGHTGAFPTLEGFLRYHADPVAAEPGWQPEVVLPAGIGPGDDFAPRADPEHRAAILAAVSAPPVTLDDDAIADLVAFLDALTDEDAAAGRLGIPDSVPSGLPVDR